jgi:hypothetical protein
MGIVFAQELDRSMDFLLLLLGIVHRQMRMHFSVGADFEELDPQQLFHFGVVFRDPFAGHKEGGGDLVLDQVVHQRLIVARAFSYGTEIERQRDPRAGRRS